MCARRRVKNISTAERLSYIIHGDKEKYYEKNYCGIRFRLCFSRLGIDV